MEARAPALCAVMEFYSNDQYITSFTFDMTVYWSSVVGDITDSHITFVDTGNGEGSTYSLSVINEDLGEEVQLISQSNQFEGEFTLPDEVMQWGTCKFKITFASSGYETESGEISIVLPTSTIQITCATPGADIRYTLDGSDPTKESAQYAEPIEVAQGATVKAIAFKEGFLNSDIGFSIAKPAPINWIAIEDMKLATRDINSICYGDGKFVAISDTPTMASYSENGIDWVEIPKLYLLMTSIMNSICYGNGKFITVGSQGDGFYSEDGINWTEISDMKFNTTAIYSICYGNGKFIAVGGEGKASYSEDGINWTAVDDMKFGTSRICSICYGNGRFVAVGYDGKGSYSEDGINWTAVDDMKFGEEIGVSYINGIAYGNGKFVAIGTNRISYSSDAINWTIIDVNIAAYSICYGNGEFIISGAGANAISSTDGINWTAIDDMVVTANAICYGSDKFVAVGNDGEGAYCIA